MFIKHISKTIIAVFFLIIVSSLTANATIITYDFDIQLDSVIGINPYGLDTGDSVHAVIGLNTDHGLLDSSATYSMHSPHTDSDFSLSLEFGTTTFDETDDTWYDGWPVVTLKRSDWTLDTVDFLSSGSDYTISISEMVLNGYGNYNGVSWSLSGDIPQGLKPVPEPSTSLFLAMGLLGLVGVSRRCKY